MTTLQSVKQAAFRRRIILLSAFVLLLLLIALGLSLGSSDITPGQLWNALMQKGDERVYQVLVNIRMPRVLAAVFSGLALSVSGAVIQTVIRNPLGSPYTLGLSSAAAFGAAFSIVVLGIFSRQASGYLASLQALPHILAISAFAMSLLSAGFITLFARWRSATPESLIMAGIILTALFASATNLLQYFSTEVELSAIISWLFGDLGKANWTKTYILLLVSLPCLLFFVWHSWSYNALNAGDEVARSLGVRVDRLRMWSVVVASLCAAVTVAFFGIIAFVGLVVPHITRWLIGQNQQAVLIGSAIFGALFLLLSDIVARTLVAPVVIPVGIVTSFVGAPFFLLLLIRHIKRR